MIFPFADYKSIGEAIMKHLETAEESEAVNRSSLSDKKRLANFMCKRPEEKH